MRSRISPRHLAASLALGAAVMVAQPVAAATTVYTADTDALTTPTTVILETLSLLAGSTINLFASTPASPFSFGVFVYSLVDTATNTPVWSGFSAVVSGFPSTAGYIVGASGSYTLFAQIMTGTATLTATVDAVPVPAPVVAAGVPGVLALMGFAAWRRRNVATA